MRVQQKILSTVSRFSDLPFRWGETDCLALCGEVARALCGEDPTVSVRAQYTTENEAKRVMVSRGWENMGAVAASLREPVPPAMARTGDWAWVVNEDGTESLGVVIGDKVVAKTREGIGWVPRTRARGAYSVR